MQHYFCVHPTNIGTNYDNDFRLCSTKAGRTRLKCPRFEFQRVCSNNVSHVGPQKTRTVKCLLDLFSSGWQCCALLSLSPVIGRHLEF